MLLKFCTDVAPYKISQMEHILCCYFLLIRFQQKKLAILIGIILIRLQQKTLAVLTGFKVSS